MDAEDNRRGPLRRAVNAVKDCLFAVLFALAWLLGGCATTETVKVPVPAPCTVEEPKEPQWYFKPPYGDVFDGTKALLADRVQALAYQEQLRSALKACR